MNSVFLKNRIAELGLKQWWIAEQIGVDRKTVTRWMQGHVRSIQPENLEALASILKCRVIDLVLQSESDQLATEEDQIRAAEALSKSSLIDRLGPIGEWNVIESLLKATLVQGLPLNVLGDLYNQLTVASWRQSKLDQAETYNQKALLVAEKCQDQEILAKAKLSAANLASWRGRNQAAIQLYREVLALHDFIDARTLGSTHSNLGAVLYESGDLASGRCHLNSALEHFAVHGRPMNLSITHGHLAQIAIQESGLESAESHCERSIQFAEADQYLRGLAFGDLLRAQILALRDQKSEAMHSLRSALEAYAKLKIEEGLNYEIAGRVCRIIGELEKSEQYIKKGLEISERFPGSMAALYFELAQTLRAQSRPYSEAAKKAQSLYTQCEAPLRAKMVDDWQASKSIV